MTKNKVLNYVYAIVPVVLTLTLGSIFVGLGMDYFKSLITPDQFIPSFIIPIVWSVIYVAFAVVLSLWLNSAQQMPLLTKVLLVINGVLNVLWCLVFFTLQLTFLGNVIIVLNLIAGIWLALEIARTNKIYALATIIYPIWLCLATTLNLALWILN